MRAQDVHAPGRPPVIAIGGMDRAGKSMARSALLEHLEEQGYVPVYRWSRIGYTWRIERAKRLFRRLWGAKAGAGDASPVYPQRAARMRNPLKRRLWTTLALLDLLWEYAITVRTLRARGRAVVCDRWICDALVDLRVNFPQDRLEKRLVWRLLTKLALRPDLSLLLLIPAEESLRRAHESGRRRIEPREVLEARLLEYRRIAATGLGDAIDAARSPEAIAKDLCARLDARLERGRSPALTPKPAHRGRVAPHLPANRP
jgi:thymidylate kinase